MQVFFRSGASTTLFLPRALPASRSNSRASGRYDQDAEGVAAALESVEVGDAWDVEGTLRQNAGLPPAALAALDNALHDLAARRLGVPVYRMLGLGKPEP